MADASTAEPAPLKYYPGYITGIAFADGSGYHLFFESQDGTFKSWVLCSEGAFDVGKVAYANKSLVAAFVGDPNGSNTVLGQIFIYPQ
jgi:hypothetical protein